MPSPPYRVDLEKALFALGKPRRYAGAWERTLGKQAVEEKVLDLARRGLVVSSRKGIRYRRNPSTLHDNIRVIAAVAGAPRNAPTRPRCAFNFEFICFCCGCCCLVLDPTSKVGATKQILAPSRFAARVDNENCDGCLKCPMHCAFDAIEMKDLPGYAEQRAVIDPEKCMGCGACVPKCPIEGALTMELAQPPEFIPETISGPSSVVHI